MSDESPTISGSISILILPTFQSTTTLKLLMRGKSCVKLCETDLRLQYLVGKVYEALQMKVFAMVIIGGSLII